VLPILTSGNGKPLDAQKRHDVERGAWALLPETEAEGRHAKSRGFLRPRAQTGRR
jgi:hypothetical protein